MAAIMKFVPWFSAALLAATLTIGVAAAPASAGTGTMNCTGSGTVQLTSGPASTVGWTIDLTGASCTTSLETLGGTVSGTGGSQNLGLCPAPPTSPTSSLTVDDLSIEVTESLSGALGGVTLDETWGASSTSFPETTPFQITRGGAVVGGGTIYTHIYAHCPPTGSPSAYVTWSEESPV
jgi:hypothetical protein